MRSTLALEVPILAIVPVVFVVCLLWQFDQSGAVMFMAAIVSIAAFLVVFELRRPNLRVIMPTVVLGALAAAGRILFAPFPDVKPVSAICIMAGSVFGRQCGFLVGALAALVSNFFFGQGAWTPFQMYAWGLIGWLAGVLGDAGAFDWRPMIAGRRRTSPWLYVFGFASCLLYGLILNTWYLVGYVHPVTWASALIAYGSGFALDLVHAIATVVFLALMYAPSWKKLTRIKQKYGLA